VAADAALVHKVHVYHEGARESEWATAACRKYAELGVRRDTVKDDEQVLV
jgi:hypothetical protein